MQIGSFFLVVFLLSFSIRTERLEYQTGIKVN